ncbi:wiskott-Aldrich syndrome protein homolog 1-like [Zea mays]|uniref:wiskott-Aldrich syndrome protein homolog 1-like n=1 Tax=Zea mays TaxID=4577 RepID=UPI0009A953A0|nr:wiskott-Aldrich syndrome protein homolog 1-like [Zea mays]|eukprot:XP_020394350.1 wiskott-Aldrich syndrome protein homolog 1-like [Zea mays]
MGLAPRRCEFGTRPDTLVPRRQSRAATPAFPTRHGTPISIARNPAIQATRAICDNKSSNILAPNRRQPPPSTQMMEFLKDHATPIPITPKPHGRRAHPHALPVPQPPKRVPRDPCICPPRQAMRRRRARPARSHSASRCRPSKPPPTVTCDRRPEQPNLPAR